MEDCLQVSNRDLVSATARDALPRLRRNVHFPPTVANHDPRKQVRDILWSFDAEVDSLGRGNTALLELHPRELDVGNLAFLKTVLDSNVEVERGSLESIEWLLPMRKCISEMGFGHVTPP